MPKYQNLFPPSSLAPCDVGFSFNNEAFPGSAQAGSQFALVTAGGYAPETGYTVRWQTIFGSAPSAVSIILQSAMADVDAEYQQLDASTNTSGEAHSHRCSSEILTHQVCLFDRRRRPYRQAAGLGSTRP